MLATAWLLKGYAEEGIDVYKKYQEKNNKVYNNSENEENYLNKSFKADGITILGFANGGVKTDQMTSMKQYFFVLDKQRKTLVYYESNSSEQLNWEHDNTVPSEFSDKPLTIENAISLINKKKESDENKLYQLNKKIKFLGVIELVNKDKKSKFVKQEKRITITVQADGQFLKKNITYELEPITKTVDEWEITIKKTVPELFQKTGFFSFGGKKSRKSRKKSRKSRKKSGKSRKKSRKSRKKSGK